MRLRVDEDTDLQGGEPVTLVVRPEGISLMGLEETVPEGTALRGTIENYSFLGRMIRYWVRVGEEVFVIDDANVDLTGARTGDVPFSYTHLNIIEPHLLVCQAPGPRKHWHPAWYSGRDLLKPATTVWQTVRKAAALREGRPYKSI